MRCKNGDLAYINNSIRPPNIGLIVTCVEYLGFYLMNDMVEMDTEFWLAPITDDYWKISSPNGSLVTQYGKSKVGYIPDKWLTPITGTPLGKETDEDKELVLDDLISV